MKQNALGESCLKPSCASSTNIAHFPARRTYHFPLYLVAAFMSASWEHAAQLVPSPSQ